MEEGDRTGVFAETVTATFLFTDIEGSSRLWDQHGDAMRAALGGHEVMARETVSHHGGAVVKDTGDGVLAVFSDPCSAVLAAVELQTRLAATSWPEVDRLRVRMGLHVGRAELRGGDYHGATLNRAARLMGVAHGGQVLVSDALRAVVVDELPESFALVDLGEHRLRDLSRPERIFQLNGPGLPSEHPGLRSVDSLPGNLPSQLTSFVGRADDLQHAAAAIMAERLVTMTGPGGVGKTRLAVHVGGEILPRFADGVWLCELAAVHDAAGIHQVVAAVFGVERRAGLTLEDSITGFLAERRVLLIFDNCEHVLRDAGALIRRLLQRAPEVRILATSREPLAIEGEHVWPVRSLAVPDADTGADEFAEAPAVQLFVDRARSVRPGFTSAGVNSTAVADICRRLDGIPLAIELAAARTLAMSPREIAEHLDERFRLLTGGRRGALERHQTLRSVVDWSYSLLTDLERAVFDRLSVFAGGFDIHAAEAVAAGDRIELWDVVDAVSALVGKSMVVASERIDGTTRFHTLETLRQYARERLGEHDHPDRWRAKHAAYFAELAEGLHAELKGPRLRDGRRRFRAELDNFRSAVMWSLDASPETVEVGARIIAAFAIEVANDPTTGVESWGEQALAHVDELQPSLAAQILGVASFSALASGDLDRCTQLADRALHLVPPEEVVARHTALVARAVTAMYVDPVAACSIAAHPSGTGLDEQHPFEFSLIATTRAYAASMLGRRAMGRPHAQEGVAYAVRCGSPTAMASGHGALAFSYLDEDPRMALAALDVAFQHFGGGNTSLTGALQSAAEALAGLGDRFALVRLREAVEFTHRSRWRLNIVGNLRLAAHVFASLDMLDEAAVVLGASEASHWPAAMLPADREWLTQVDKTLRARFERRRLEELRASGRAMSYDEVLEFLRSTTPPPATDWAREAQVT